MLGERFDIPDTLPAPEMIEAVARVRPRYIRVQPIALEIMCAHDSESKLADLGVEAVFTVGDGFSPEAKRNVSLHLGCRIMDHYASQECGRIATSCPGCGQFHIDADINVVDVLNDEGVPAQPGETGRIIVTPLYNYAMPLIRYDHADYVKAGAVDDCVIKLPALEAIYGKDREPFRFADGTVIRPHSMRESWSRVLARERINSFKSRPTGAKSASSRTGDGPSKCSSTN
jgi:phenylacetate-CoA ligase